MNTALVLIVVVGVLISGTIIGYGEVMIAKNHYSLIASTLD